MMSWFPQHRRVAQRKNCLILSLGCASLIFISLLRLILANVQILFFYKGRCVIRQEAIGTSMLKRCWGELAERRLGKVMHDSKDGMWIMIEDLTILRSN